MADSRISDYSALAGSAIAVGDLTEVVDVSDLSLAASGTNKKTTATDLTAFVRRYDTSEDIYTKEWTTTTPAAPTDGTIIFGKKRGGRRMSAQIGPSGIDYSFQPALFGNKIMWFNPRGNSNAVTDQIGTQATAVVGTATAENIATTNILTQARRVGLLSAATAGASAEWRSGSLQFHRGNAAGLGGFFFVFRFGFTTIPATKRWFVGLTASAAALTNADQSTITNIIGIGCDSGDTSPQFMHNDGSGTATKTSSGLANIATGTLYEARIFSKPNGSDVQMSFEVVNTANLAEYDSGVSTDLPSATQLLAPHLWANNGATAAALQLSVVSVYGETDN